MKNIYQQRIQGLEFKCLICWNTLCKTLLTSFQKGISYRQDRDMMIWLRKRPPAARRFGEMSSLIYILKKNQQTGLFEQQ